MARADSKTSLPEMDRRPWLWRVASPPPRVPPDLVRLVMRASAIPPVRPGRSSVIALRERGGIADAGRGSGVSSGGGPLADGPAAPGNSASGFGGAGGGDVSGGVASGSLVPDSRGCGGGRSGGGSAVDVEDDGGRACCVAGIPKDPPSPADTAGPANQKGWRHARGRNRGWTVGGGGGGGAAASDVGSEAVDLEIHTMPLVWHTWPVEALSTRTVERPCW